MASPGGSDDQEEYVDALGVVTALERTCELEARLRQAIQDTHPLTTTLDWDFNAADKEREGLLAIGEQLEYLEDKLREYRFLEPSEMEHKAVLLSQLDAVRRELVDVVDQYMPHITFGKEVVREVLAFAQVSDDSAAGGVPDLDAADAELLQGAEQLPPGTLMRGGEGGERLRRRQPSSGSGSLGSGSGSLGSGSLGSGSGNLGGFASEIEADPEAQPAAPSSGGAASRHMQRTAGMYGTDDAELGDGAAPGSGGGGLIPAIRRGGGLPSRPPRYPSKEPAQMIPGPKGTRPASSSAPAATAAGVSWAGAPTSPSSLHQRNQQQLALLQQQQSPPSRSAFLQQQQQHDAAAAAAATAGTSAQRVGFSGGHHPLGANTVPGAPSAVATRASGATSPGAAATASALRSAAASAAGLAGRSGRRQLDVDAAARGMVSAARGASAAASSGGGGGGDAYSFAHQAAPAQAAAPVAPAQARLVSLQQQQQHAMAAAAAAAAAAPAPAAAARHDAAVHAHPIPPPSSYAPSSYAPSEGAPSSRQSPYSTRTTSGAPAVPPPPAAAALAQRLGQRLGGSKLLSRLNRTQGYGDSASSSRYEAYSRISDEDIYGALEGSKSRPASILNPPPGQYGGFVRIRDRLSRVEDDEAAKVPGPHTERRSPLRPRIYGEAEGRRDSSDGWETASEIHPAGYAASLSLDPPSREQRPSERALPRITHSAPAPRPRSPPRERLHLAYSSGGAGGAGRSGRPDHSTARGGVGVDPGPSVSRSGRSVDGSGSSGGLVGRLTNLLLTGAAAAAVAVVAQHAGPAVVQKGHEVARSLQGTQAAVASKWQAHQRRREAQQQERERAREQQRKQQQERERKQERERERKQERERERKQQQEREQEREREQQRKKQLQQQQSGRMADLPATRSTFRAMADLPPSPPRQEAPQQLKQQQQPRPAPSGGGGAPLRRMADLPSPQPSSPKPGGNRMADMPSWDRQQQAAAAAAAAAAAQRNRNSSHSGRVPAASPLGGGRAAVAALGGGSPPPAGAAAGGGGYLGPPHPHMAGAGRGTPGAASVAGSSVGTPQRTPPAARGGQPGPGQLFPAMPPPDVCASMG